MGQNEVERDHETRVSALTRRFGERVKARKEEVDRLTTEWNRIRADEMMRLPRYSSQLFYWPFMAILAVAEAPLNRLSFELFFTESPLVSFGVALLCGTVLIVLAHFLGVGLCRFRYNREIAQLRTDNRKSGVGYLLSLVMLSAMIGLLCYGLAILRQGYLTFALGSDPAFANLLSQDQYTQAAILVLTLSLKVEGVIFLVINLAVVFVGVMAAIFCHDPHPEYERIDRQLTAARTALGFSKRVLDEQIAKEGRFYEEEIQHARENDDGGDKNEGEGESDRRRRLLNFSPRS